MQIDGVKIVLHIFGSNKSKVNQHTKFPVLETFLYLLIHTLERQLPTQVAVDRLANLLKNSLSCKSAIEVLPLHFTPLWASSDRHLSTDPVTQIILDISPLFTRCIRDCHPCPSGLPLPVILHEVTLFKQFGTNWCLFRVKIFPFAVADVCWCSKRMSVGSSASGREKCLLDISKLHWHKAFY